MKIVAHIPGKEILERNLKRIERAAANGFGVELQLTADVLENVPLKFFAKVKEILKEKPVTFHAPFLDLNPGAVDSYVREATIKRYREMKPIEEILNPEGIVFHSGFHPRKILPIYDRWFRNCVDTFQQIADLFKNTKIAIENVFDETPEHLIKLISAIDRENAGICLDIGHWKIFSSLPLSEWIESCKDKLFEFHIHDNDGKNDLHIAAGEGTIDFSDLIKLLNSKKNISQILTMEAKTEEDQLKSYNFILSNLQGVKNGNTTLSS
ncbi:sugar phosphate isomerase/epimerase family protein [Desulfurobacterium atlanticum]|uniref:Sugar phosphate isomerase/epimerase n=1 Tax=Desulfurobacterium atlanticum TaxID=240169 RepID=A0A238Y1G9_9BACT|nr:sugar phosphate isomerase/epimerase family protein [Desulfurobacterium atlanticum]SNR64503.1 Sugar phosphate isomerase/epimerase [Desulfurobacterium atlanticum]